MRPTGICRIASAIPHRSCARPMISRSNPKAGAVTQPPPPDHSRSLTLLQEKTGVAQSWVSVSAPTPRPARSRPAGKPRKGPRGRGLPSDALRQAASAHAARGKPHFTATLRACALPTRRFAGSPGCSCRGIVTDEGWRLPPAQRMHEPMPACVDSRTKMRPNARAASLMRCRRRRDKHHPGAILHRVVLKSVRNAG